MTRLSDAGERISDTLFNALVINGLPEQYEQFVVVQESFQPATNVPRAQDEATQLRRRETGEAWRAAAWQPCGDAWAEEGQFTGCEEDWYWTQASDGEGH